MVSAKNLEAINTLLFIGAGLYSLWYFSTSIAVTPEERQILKTILQQYRNDARVQHLLTKL